MTERWSFAAMAGRMDICGTFELKRMVYRGRFEL
jgi:hypothetical protein